MSEQNQVPQNANEPDELSPDELTTDELESASGGGDNQCPNYSNCVQN